MNTTILIAVNRIVFPLLLVFSLFLLARGHNAPGGGFIAGLMTASALVIQGVVVGWRPASRMLPVRSTTVLALGLALAAGTGFAAMIQGRPFLDHTFTHAHLPLYGDVELASAVIFDLGVYLIVVAGAHGIILTLAQAQRRPTSDEEA